MDSIIINGEIVKKHEVGATSFFWDETFGITQKWWFGFGGIPLFHDHVEQLKTMLETMGAEIPDLFNDERELFRIVKRMLNKNRYYRSGIISCQVYISQSRTDTVIQSKAFPEFDYPLSGQGLILHFSEFEKYSADPLGKYSFCNVPQWKFADARSKGTMFDNSIFMNENGVVCDCVASNIFMIKGNAIYTPSIDTGCYIDVLRHYILEAAQKVNLKPVEPENISKEDVLQMDEIFLASEGLGIQWVLGVENKRFVHNHSVRIHEFLNELLKKRVK
jgi:branched-chain amino acid aminotransferase